MTDDPWAGLENVWKARRSPLVWLVLLLGCICVAAALMLFTTDLPQDCDMFRGCPTVLRWFFVPLCLLFFVAPLLGLLRGDTSGVVFDRDSGDLTWWERGRLAAPKGRGRIHPSQIARVELRVWMDDPPDLRLVASDGQIVPGFSQVLVRGDARKWAEGLIACWPHIRLREVDHAEWMRSGFASLMRNIPGRRG